MIITVGMGIGALCLYFRRARCRLTKVEDHDVTLLKVPRGEDPTYGVRAHQDSATLGEAAYSSELILYIISICRKSMTNSVHREVGPGCHTWSKERWQGKSPWWSVLVRLFLHLLLRFTVRSTSHLCSGCRQRQIWGGLEGHLDGGECGRQDLLLQG